jgi:hypothetical protein
MNELPWGIVKVYKMNGFEPIKEHIKCIISNDEKLQFL